MTENNTTSACCNAAINELHFCCECGEHAEPVADRPRLTSVVQFPVPVPAATLEVENDVPHILEALCEHDDCPEWLKEELFEVINKGQPPLFSAHYWKCALEEVGPYFEARYPHLYQEESSDEPAEEFPDVIHDSRGQFGVIDGGGQ